MNLTEDWGTLLRFRWLYTFSTRRLPITPESTQFWT